MKNVFVLITIIIFISCSKETAVEIEVFPCESDAIEIVEKDKQAQAVTEFGMDLFQEIVRSDFENNTVLSPISVYSALLMAYEGSACETKKQIMRTLKIGEGNQHVSSSIAYRNFMDAISPKEGGVEFTSANGLFLDPSRAQFSEHYIEGLVRDYETESSSLDFGEPEALDVINGWAEEKTNEKIKEVLKEISGDEIAFLLNAIYYSGEWLNGFDDQITLDRTFTLRDGSVIEVPTMKRDAESTFYIDNNYQIVDMDIKGEEYAVSFLSSSQSSHIDNLLLSDNFLSDYQMLLTKLETDRLELALPKFELEGKNELKDILKSMGISDAFDSGAADFKRMGTAGENIFLTRVLHDTYIKVDEKGIEGAAVTTIGVAENSVPPPMYFDKAFVFILRHKETGVPIFMGKVEDPRN